MKDDILVACYVCNSNFKCNCSSELQIEKYFKSCFIKPWTKNVSPYSLYLNNTLIHICSFNCREKLGTLTIKQMEPYVIFTKHEEPRLDKACINITKLHKDYYEQFPLFEDIRKDIDNIIYEYEKDKEDYVFWNYDNNSISTIREDEFKQQIKFYANIDIYSDQSLYF